MALTLKLDLSSTAIDSALSDYPVRVSTVSIGSTANADVFTEDSGSGADTWFSSDEAGSSPIDAKLLYWSDADSEFAFDVEVASVSATVATTIYLQVGSKPGAYGTDPYDANRQFILPLTSDLNDASSNGNDPTLTGSVAAGTRTGPDGVIPAGDFPGSGSYLDFGLFDQLDSASAFTISAWIDFDSIADNMTILSDWVNGSGGHVLARTGGSGELELFVKNTGQSGGSLSPATSISTSAGWQHVVWQFDNAATTLRAYIDGASDSLAISSGTLTTVNTNALQAGQSPHGTFEPLNAGVASLALDLDAKSAAWINADNLLQGSGSATYWTVTDVTGGGGATVGSLINGGLVNSGLVNGGLAA